MSYWRNLPSSASNLRLFEPDLGWKRYDDFKPEGGGAQAGSRRLIESAFLNAFNSTNLLLLTGAGSSFAAKNPKDDKQAPGMATLWKAVQDRFTKNRFDEVCAAFKGASLDENIERLLTLCKLYLELHEKADSADKKLISDFVKEAEATILELVDFVNSKTQLDSHTIVVQRMGRRGNKKPRARVFTTNYDLCFEEAARRQRFIAIDGFSHSLEQVYDRSFFEYDIVRRDQASNAPDYLENVFQLYKLHGSVDWRRIGKEIFRVSNARGEPVLIYPRSSKYQQAFEAPYLDMMGSLQASLREKDTAVIISGFGFNDDHLSRPILSAFEANLSLRLIICDPIFLSDEILVTGDHVATGSGSSNEFLQIFQHLAAGGDPRIHLINGRFEDMALALPDLVGETDRERHANRLRNLVD